ncbi:MAG: DNA-3-methyladenine glycosylase 2 family protein [Anaerolineaceae bacterium]|nr:MAG: DNA-3-methyladenine glycosylase 2 family protein [Anaerolineaceae bacterium]
MRIRNKNFDIKQIAESGQCFRMDPISENKHSLIAFDRYIELEQVEEDLIDISCSKTDYEFIWKDYFDLDFDYGSIVGKLNSDSDEFLKAASSFGRGIRILRQDPFETLISFIISQNKNIPSIKVCIERICETYGNRMKDNKSGRDYYTFPTPIVLAEAKKEDLRALKLGYRDEYIIGAARAVAVGDIDLNALKICSHDEAVKALKSIKGIGDKVANCISLFGLHHIEAFPIDVWMKRVLSEYYQDKFDPEKYSGYAGIVQQYMFYYIRHIHGVSN